MTYIQPCKPRHRAFLIPGGDKAATYGCILLLGMAALDAMPTWAETPSLIPGASSHTDTNTAPKAETVDQPATIEAQRAAIQERITKLQAEQQGLEADSPALDGLNRKVDLLQRTNAALAQWLSILQETHDLTEEVKTKDAAIESLREQGPGEAAVSFVAYDSASDRITLEEERLRQTEDRYELCLHEADQAKKTAREKESAYRLQKESASDAAGKAGESAEATRLVIAELERNLATSTASMRAAELTLEKIRRQAIQKALDALRITQGWAKDRVSFTETDLKQNQGLLDELEKNLRKDLGDAESGLGIAETRLQDALQAATSDPIAPDQQGRIDAARLERRFRQRQITIINMRLERTVQARLLWYRRFRL